MRACSRARTSPTDPLQRIADQVSRWKLVNPKDFIVPGKHLIAGNQLESS
jgi:hypothetical protein